MTASTSFLSGESYRPRGKRKSGKTTVRSLRSRNNAIAASLINISYTTYNALITLICLEMITADPGISERGVGPFSSLPLLSSPFPCLPFPPSLLCKRLTDGHTLVPCSAEKKLSWCTLSTWNSAHPGILIESSDPPYFNVNVGHERTTKSRSRRAP